MIPAKHILFLVILSCVFTWVIFVVDNTLFAPKIDEEQHIEPTLPEDFTDIQDTHIHENVTTLSWASTQTGITVSEVSEEIVQHYIEKIEKKQAEEKIFFSYIPQLFRDKTHSYEGVSRDFLSSDSVRQKIKKLQIEFYKDLLDVRGKMKGWTIKMFGLLELGEGEFLSVFIHEFWHYLDIYFFSQGSFGDTSKNFYNISWESTKVLRWWQNQTDFVSGYAMTNKYEDFAESFTYYILHNDDFLEKSEKSELLRDKYNFFWKYLFFEWEFIGTDFSEWNVIRSYYWDITKIDIDINKFLQYIKNTI